MPTTFLSLPAELRNRIYDLALEDTPINISLQLQEVEIVNGFGYASWVEEETIYALPEERSLRKQMAHQGHVIALLFVCKQTYADLSHSIYSNFNLRLHPNCHEYQLIDDSHDDQEFIHTIIDNPRLARLRSLTSKLITVTSPLSLHRAWLSLVFYYPLSFEALEDLVFFDNNALEYSIDDTIPVEEHAAKDVIRKRQNNVAIKVAKEHQKKLSCWHNQVRGLKVTLRITMALKDMCIHPEWYGDYAYRKACLSTVCETTLVVAPEASQYRVIEYDDAFRSLRPVV